MKSCVINKVTFGELCMKTMVYDKLPKEAREIRETVFVKEQGFHDEFDELDAAAKHLVLYDEEMPIATCRFFRRKLSGDYTVGRIAVRKEYRGKNIGTCLLNAAEEEIRNSGGKRVFLHAQCSVQAFYRKQGYSSYGETDLDEDCPHIWMKKSI